MSNEKHICGCGGEITRKRTQGPWPRQCADCKANGIPLPKPAPRIVEEEVEPTASESSAELDLLAYIADQKMDYCVGSAFRFIAEYQDGDELENLRNARVYLDAAIAAREA